MPKVKRRPNLENKRAKGLRLPTHRLDGNERAGRKRDK